MDNHNGQSTEQNLYPYGRRWLTALPEVTQQKRHFAVMGDMDELNALWD